jgi:hypothetical protein
MTNHANAEAGCLLVGEYVDEAELPANVICHRGEVVHPQVVANYLDYGSTGDGFIEFTVLLKDGRIVAVRGHSLRALPPSAGGESGSYGIVVRSGDKESLVALFQVLEVVGIFHGVIRPDQQTA